jgi:hypothetical protein
VLTSACWSCRLIHSMPNPFSRLVVAKLCRALWMRHLLRRVDLGLADWLDEVHLALAAEELSERAAGFFVMPLRSVSWIAKL